MNRDILENLEMNWDILKNLKINWNILENYISYNIYYRKLRYLKKFRNDLRFLNFKKFRNESKYFRKFYIIYYILEN